MSDLKGTNAPQPIGITGLNTSGVPTTPVNSDSSGNLFINAKVVATTTDQTGSGTITALNGTVVATTNGCSTITFNVTGTWSATIQIQGTVDQTNWFVINGDIDTTDTIESSFTVNGFITIPCGSYPQVRLIATAFTSGTVSAAWSAGVGNSLEEVFSTNAASFQSQVQGTVASGSADSGNGVKVSGVYNTTIPSLSNGNRGDLQVDSRSILQTTLLDGSRQTYSATATFTAANIATDVFTITGSATKTVRISKVGFSATQTTAGIVNLILLKRSAANSGGTSSAATAVPLDSNNAAATATVLSYTANPTSLGALVGDIRNIKLMVPVVAVGGNTSSQTQLEENFGNSFGQAIVLRGTSQVFAVNLNSTTIAGNSFSIWLEWCEE